jgi:hypothetical protein
MNEDPLLTLTLGAAWRGYVYTAECGACHHYIRVDLKRIAEQLGDDFPLQAVRERLHCSQCGAKRINIALLEKSHSSAARHLQRWPFDYDRLRSSDEAGG